VKLFRSVLFWSIAGLVAYGLMVFYFLLRWGSGASQPEVSLIGALIFLFCAVCISVAYVFARHNIVTESNLQQRRERLNNLNRSCIKVVVFFGGTFLILLLLSLWGYFFNS
jgi:hypothetical protein